MYRHLSNEEFLVLLSYSRTYSPIVESLCNRIEELSLVKEQNVVSDKVECPICKASLRVDFDLDNEIYQLKIGE